MVSRSWSWSLVAALLCSPLAYAQEDVPDTSAAGVTQLPDHVDEVAVDDAAPAPPPPSPSWSPVFTASFFSRYELRRGYDDLGLSSATSRSRLLEGDAIYYRARFGIGTGLIDVGQGLKVALQFTPQAAGTFGNLTPTPSAPNTIVDAALGLHEGYARIQGSYVRFDAGRFEMSYGDALLIGNNDWNEVGRTFDGVRARFARSDDGAWIDLFATLVDEGRPDVVRGQTLDSAPGVGRGDVYFAGAYAALGPTLLPGLELDTYVLLRAWADAENGDEGPTYLREQAAELTWGVRAKQRIASFDYRFEAGVQAGSRPGTIGRAIDVRNVKARAYQADLELGAMLGERARLGIEALYASGDDANTGRNEGWDELFPTAHKTLGLTDAFVLNGQKRTNVTSALAHLTLTPWERLTVQLDAMLFARPERSEQYRDRRGYAGSEVDLGLVMRIAQGLRVRASYAVFLPSSALYRDRLPYLVDSVDPVHFAEFELRYDLAP